MHHMVDGHLNAAKSIYECMQTKETNLDIELIDCMKYVNKAIEKLTTAAYREMAKKAPWAWGKIYSDSQKGPLAHISSRSNKIFAIKLLKLLREKQPDIIISTHFFGSQMCSYLKRKGKIKKKRVLWKVRCLFSTLQQKTIRKISRSHFQMWKNLRRKSFWLLKCCQSQAKRRPSIRRTKPTRRAIPVQCAF